MQVSVTFRHMEATDALKVFAADKVGKIEKYIHAPTDAHVVLSVERGHLHRAEINVTANGLRIRGEDTTGDMYGSIDGATAKIEKQLKRWRNKLSSHKPRDGVAMKVRHDVIEPMSGSDAEVPHEAPAQVVHTEELDARPMLVEEAIMQIDLAHQDYIVFVNAKSNAMNVLYRRATGGFGLIEPPRHAR